MQLVRDGDLVLMDAGTEYSGYCSDLTRTWPVSGTFTPQQRDVYEVVHDTHRLVKHPYQLMHCALVGGSTLHSPKVWRSVYSDEQPQLWIVLAINQTQEMAECAGNAWRRASRALR